jgi:small subunit ribosomal protein S8
MMTDPVADMLTRIRNANMINDETVDIPASKLKLAIAGILKEEGYITDYEKIDDNKQGMIRIEMKYTPKGEKIIHELRRISKPGRRRYLNAKDIENTCGGLGIAVISTSKGVMTGQKAKSMSIGGEYLCDVW